MTTNFEPHEFVIFVQSTKIGTHENKAIHSTVRVLILAQPYFSGNGLKYKLSTN